MELLPHRMQRRSTFGYKMSLTMRNTRNNSSGSTPTPSFDVSSMHSRSDEKSRSSHFVFSMEMKHFTPMPIQIKRQLSLELMMAIVSTSWPDTRREMNQTYRSRLMLFELCMKLLTVRVYLSQLFRF